MRFVYTDLSDPTIRHIARSTFPEYRGHKVNLRALSSVELNNTYWDGGSRSSYAACRLADGATIRLPQFDPPQFGGPMRAPKFEVEPGIAVVEHRIFRGKDMGLIISIHPETLAPLLPPAESLSLEEKLVLVFTRALTSAGRKQERERYRIPTAVWNSASQRLKDRGLLRKNGAITNEGRNAAGQDSYSSVGSEWRESQK